MKIKLTYLAHSMTTTDPSKDIPEFMKCHGIPRALRLREIVRVPGFNDAVINIDGNILMIQRIDD